MRNLSIILLSLAVCVGCSNADNATGESTTENTDLPPGDEIVLGEPELLDEGELKKEIEGLSTNHEKIAFLKNILTEDQRVRTEEADANQAYGYESAEHKKKIAQLMEVDAHNLQKINLFTEINGEPQENSVGRMQTEAIWLVVHHAPGVDNHERYFQVLYDAWEDEVISGAMFTFYLNRWYEKVSGERHIMEGKYTDAEEVDVLVNLLGVTPK